jgi:hypothetical protein
MPRRKGTADTAYCASMNLWRGLMPAQPALKRRGFCRRQFLTPLNRKEPQVRERSAENVVDFTVAAVPANPPTGSAAITRDLQAVVSAPAAFFVATAGTLGGLEASHAATAEVSSATMAMLGCSSNRAAFTGSAGAVLPTVCAPRSRPE